jgi:hypothetical protein
MKWYFCIGLLLECIKEFYQDRQSVLIDRLNGTTII